MRFDAGTVPVGYLVFRSDTRSLGEIQDLALNRVRPQFATLPGLTSPPPFGGSQRSIVIRVDPDRLRSYGMAPDEVVRAVTTGNVIIPSGSVNIGEETRISPINSVVGTINDLLDLPIRTGAGVPVSIRDVGSVTDDSTDIPTAYALVNGRRAVYIPVTKRPDASTLDVVREVRANLGRFQALVPDDIAVSYELDQSTNVSSALESVPLRSDSRRTAHRPDGARLPPRLAECGHRRRDDSVCPPDRHRRAVGRGPDDQHHDARRARAGGRHSGGRSDCRDREHPHPSGPRYAAGARRARRQRRSRRPTPARDAVRGRRLRSIVLHDRRLTLVVRSPVAGGRVRDDRLVPPLEFAGARALGLVAATVITGGDPARMRPIGWTGFGTGSHPCCSDLRRLASPWSPCTWWSVSASSSRSARRSGARSFLRAASRPSSFDSARLPVPSSRRRSSSGATCST